MELKEGVTAEAMKMVKESFAHMERFKERILAMNEEELMSNIETLPWFIAAYDKGECQAAWWGSRFRPKEINVISSLNARKKWLSRKILKQFFDYFFSKYDEAYAHANDDAAHDFLVRLGFTGERDNLVLTPERRLV